MTSYLKRLLPALALGTLVLAACANGTRLAEQSDVTRTTPTPPSTHPPATQPPATDHSPVPPSPTKDPTTRPTPTTAPPPSTPTQAPPTGTGSADSPLSLRSYHLVGKDFRVSITAVDLDADGELEAANSFNDPPHGRYVLAELTVVYLGSEEGNPWIDLTTKFVGADARQYDSNQCGAVVAHPGVFVPTLEHGGRARYQVCWDVPVSAIPHGKIFVEQTFVFEGPRVYWKTR